MAAAINNKLTLPQTRTNPAGENIRIEPVTAGENALNYSYTILDYTAEQLSDGGFDSARYMQENLPGQRSNACADKGTRKIPERGIRLHYAYSSKDGQRMVAYDILPADCDFKG